MVIARAVANHVSVGQATIEAKNNKVTAMQKLLEILEMSGRLVTIDSMGFQKEIAA